VPPRHLYVHVPFCARRCSYCDFSIAVRSSTPVEEFLTGIRTEAARVIGEGWTLDTLYLGGGTPSRLGGTGIASLLQIICDRASLAPDAEITLEANPDDVTLEAAHKWRQAGVNRVSLGAQSFDDGVLKWMHRVHSSAQVREAVSELKAAGIENISLDLIFNLPPHLNRDWRADIEKALELRPSHVSLYGLTVESHTPISRWAERGAIVEGTDSGYAEEFLYAHDAMAAAGFEHYEVSNFALPGQASRHNSAYWTGAPYAALGPSAHSFDGAYRRWNTPAYANWVKRLAAGKSVIEGKELLTAENRNAEKVYLGLRTTAGLILDESEIAAARPWVAEGWATLDGLKLRLTPTGWLRLDSLAATIAARRDRRVISPLSTTPSHCYI
jgi:oxygen-independent coproporphyrinogen III oxidase